jgi:hypothetical protein
MANVSEDDDFLDATLMTINAKRTPKEYRKIIQYLDNMKFSVRTTKVVRT